MLQLKRYPSIRGIALSSQFSKQEGGEPWGWLCPTRSRGLAATQPAHATAAAHPSTKTPREVRFGQEAAAGAPVHKQRGMPRRHSLRTQAFCSPLTTDTEQDRPPA